MHDIIQDLCTNLRDYESALVSLQNGARSGRPGEVERVTRNVELCKRWLQVAGGEVALARMRAGISAEALLRPRL